jgi:hypothetical protein
MNDKDPGLSNWQFVEALVPQAYLFEANLPAITRPTLTKLLVHVLFSPFLAYNDPSTTSF